ncbi:MAG: squalene--hopene cyclase [Chlamydiae bacterium]|nr:squalene--hopene cyclase [Chlamydiota bacterium]MBI3266558.1 squalene--hopene cyclase [Chlamydiota bacterium]
MKNTLSNIENPLESQKSGVTPSLDEKIKKAVERTQEYLLSLQHPNGYWCAELKADSTLASDYILMMYFMGLHDPDKVKKLARFILQEQLEDGSWNIYRGGPGEISATVKAYTALKLAGFSEGEPFMKKARVSICKLGGVEKCNSFTKIYLALIGEYEWEATPAIPPEMIFAPRWSYFNLYEISSWSRAIVIPLSIICAMQPVRPVPPGRGIDELFEAKRPHAIHFDRGRLISWKNFFLSVDRLLKIYRKSPWKPFRKWAIRKATYWMLERLEKSDGLAAIYPAMVNSLFALSVLGYSDDHPLVKRALKQLEEFEVEEKDTLWLQPCFSPIWDTGLSVVAIAESGIDPDHPALKKAAQWLLEKEIRRAGDWKVKNPCVEPSGWAFEFQNEFYPDVDDTIMVLMALQRLHSGAAHWPHGLIVGLEAALKRGLTWVRSMQNQDGGWASFDKNNDKIIFTKVPFADHNAMLDPSTVDVTGRVLEMFSVFGITQEDSQVKRALKFIKDEQEEDGSWYGRWGVNYIYGTWQVLKGLASMGEDMHQPDCQKAATWLRSVQNSDGGWGESCLSYDDPSQKAKGVSTPSQTAWALMGLFASGDLTSSNVKRGLEYLLATQKEDGSWDEWPFTGTGFPRVFYIKYEYYRIYFPLFAMAMYLKNMKKLTPPTPLK